MLSLLRAYHRRFGYHTRFHLAVALTIVAVAYVAVPPVVRFVQTMTGYSPHFYEPKDFARGEWLRQQESAGDQVIDRVVSWQTASSVVIFLLVAVVWLTLVPYRSPRRRPPP